jgi:hypothetical protein
MSKEFGLLRPSTSPLTEAQCRGATAVAWRPYQRRAVNAGILALKGGVAAPVETPVLDADSFDLEHELAPPSDSVVALFATVREMCGAYSRPAWPSEDPTLPFAERVQLAIAEARLLLFLACELTAEETGLPPELLLPFIEPTEGQA